MDKRVVANVARGNAGAGQRRWERSAGSVEQLTSLTPLRGVAALWVMIFHLPGIFTQSDIPGRCPKAI
jgi:peptidoglycan/LPS O-acetylase OafA/YrhL